LADEVEFWRAFMHMRASYRSRPWMLIEPHPVHGYNGLVRVVRRNVGGVMMHALEAVVQLTELCVFPTPLALWQVTGEGDPTPFVPSFNPFWYANEHYSAEGRGRNNLSFMEHDGRTLIWTLDACAPGATLNLYYGNIGPRAYRYNKPRRVDVTREYNLWRRMTGWQVVQGNLEYVCARVDMGYIFNLPITVSHDEDNIDEL